MSPVKFDGQANDAVRQNNVAVIDKNEDKPTQGGNIAKYSELSGDDKSASCFEFTMPKFQGTTGEQFVALQLALDFEQFAAQESSEDSSKKAAPDATAVAADVKADGQANPIDAPDKEATDAAAAATQEVTKTEKKASIVPGSSPILDESVSLVGISNKTHKKTINLIQVIYVKTVTNALV